MWEVEGRTTKEIAKELGIKESAVRHTVSRARASLRKVLSELIIDEARGLTALDLLSTTYKKAAELTAKSSKMALIFILVLTSFLGLNSITGNEPNTTITTSRSQLSNDQDMTIVEAPAAPATPVAKPAPAAKTITVDEYADNMALSLAQLETVTLMLQVLDQTNGGPAPTE
jgi:predicted transcriptional regulator